MPTKVLFQSWGHYKKQKIKIPDSQNLYSYGLRAFINLKSCDMILKRYAVVFTKQVNEWMDE